MEYNTDNTIIPKIVQIFKQYKIQIPTGYHFNYVTKNIPDNILVIKLSKIDLYLDAYYIRIFSDDTLHILESIYDEKAKWMNGQMIENRKITNAYIKVNKILANKDTIYFKETLLEHSMESTNSANSIKMLTGIISIVIIYITLTLFNKD